MDLPSNKVTRVSLNDLRRTRLDLMYLDRKEQLDALPSVFDRAKSLQRDKALGQIGIRDIGDLRELDWDRIFQPSREQFANTTPLVIHIGPRSGPSKCGATKGRVVEDPSTVTLLVDRYCVRCWNRWGKERASI
jgi:hypothetical protein